MPILRVIVLDPPKECPGYPSLQLVLDTKNGTVPPTQREDGSLVFETEFQFKPDKEGVPQPVGPAIVYHGDKRRFVHLNWSSEFTQYGRIKVFFERIPGFPSDAELFEARIKGRDSRGKPACASVAIEP